MNKQGSKRNLVSELADTFIMLAQIMVIYDIDLKELDGEMAFKLRRQIKRIKEAENERD